MPHTFPNFPRQDNRYGVRFPALVHLPDGNEVTVQVANVSSHGCQLKSGHHFKVGERIVVEIQKGERLNAEVRWWADGRAGVHFIGS
jgi:hypothetical protein